MVTHMSWVQQQLSGMVVKQNKEFILIDSGLRWDTFNFICLARLKNESAREKASVLKMSGNSQLMQRLAFDCSG